MATRNNKKLAALNKKNCEKHPRCNLASNSNVPRSQEDYITQVSEEIVGRVTKKLSQEFSRTENRILGALAKLDDFLMNPLLQATPEPLRRRPGMCLVLTRDWMRMTPRVTLILKQASSSLIGKTATTWRLERRERERESTQAHDTVWDIFPYPRIFPNTENLPRVIFTEASSGNVKIREFTSDLSSFWVVVWITWEVLH